MNRAPSVVTPVRGLRLLMLFVTLSGLLSLVPVSESHAAGARITDVHAEIRENLLYLDVNLDIQLDPEIVTALHNAIAIHLRLMTEIDQPRDWLWASEIESSDRSYRLEYHALSKTWLLTDYYEQETHSFSSLRGALDALEHVRAWPICNVNLLAGRKGVIGQTRMILDVNKLPLPLRLPALFDSSWSFDSDWYLWSPPYVAPAGDSGAGK